MQSYSYYETYNKLSGKFYYLAYPQHPMPASYIAMCHHQKKVTSYSK